MPLLFSQYMQVNPYSRLVMGKQYGLLRILLPSKPTLKDIQILEQSATLRELKRVVYCTYIVATTLPLTLGWLSSRTRGGPLKNDVYDFPKFRDGVLSKFVPSQWLDDLDEIRSTYTVINML